MSAQEIPPSSDASLVIIGAGFSGVTALTIARNYIPKPGRIVIADVRSTYGGQWIDAYDFVRLHQPYIAYTPFDKIWTLDKPAEYLASREEVLTHLQELGKGASADELFGYRYIGHKQVKGNDDLLEVSFQRVKGEDNTDRNDKPIKFNNSDTVKIRTKRLINCCPVSHRINKPFQFSSSKIHSIDIRSLSEDIANDNGERKTHYVIIGSGKSAMDAINYIHDNCDLKNTKVSMITGNGVAFLAREKFFPVSWSSRYFGHTDSVSVLVDYGLKWDGTNHEALMREMEREGILISAVPKPSSCMFGLLSQKELEKVKICVTEMIKGRMSDIVDSPNGEGVEILLGKTGETVPLKQFTVENRTVVVNCTELTEQNGRIRPILQDNGKTLETQLINVTPGSSVIYLTHAWFLGKLDGDDGMLSKLIGLEFPKGKYQRDRYFFTASTIAVNNFGVLLDHLPNSLMRKDRNNPLRWFPLWRQMRAFYQIYSSKQHATEFCQKSFEDLRFLSST